MNTQYCNLKCWIWSEFNLFFNENISDDRKKVQEFFSKIDIGCPKNEEMLTIQRDIPSYQKKVYLKLRLS